MIDIFTLALTHGLMALAALLLLGRADLDDEEAGERPPRPWQRRTPASDED